MRTFILITALVFSINSLLAQETGKDLQITPLTGDFYIFTTNNLYKGEKIPGNGMYLVTSQGVVLFDTPWDTTQFQPLLDSISQRHNKRVIMAVATHFHDDKTAGLEYFRSQGIKTYTTVLTDELSRKNNKKRAEFLLAGDTTFNIGEYSFETYYPGEGHAPDNIVIWFKDQKILYGGCLIKSADDKSLGYLGDANKTAYFTTVKNVMAKYSRPRYVIIGHGDRTDVKSLGHTLKMAEKLKKENAGL